MSGSPRFGLPRTMFHRVASLLGLTFIVACSGSGGSGCGGSGGMGKIKGGYPVDQRVENAISLRVTKPAFDFLETNAKTVVDKLLPPGGISVPSSCTGDTQICCGQTCKVLFDFQNLKFDPAPPSTLKMTLRAKLKTSEDFNIKAKVVITANCKLALDTTKSGKSDIGITMAVNSTADAMTKLTSLKFDSSAVDILDLDSGDITIKGDLVCDTINLLKGFFINTLKDQLKSQLAGPLDTLFCQSCTTADDCSSLANQGCSASKQCTRNGACLQQLGFEGQIDLSTLTGKPAGTGAALEYYAVAGGYSAVEAAPTSGLSLGMLGGATVSAKSTCVPARPAPTRATPPPKTAQYSGNTTPKGDPYHVGAGISTLELDSLGHAFYQSGALCLSIGSEQVDALGSGLLSALIPSLGDLTRGQNSAVQLVIKPQQPPTFTLGKGTFKVDGMGKRVIDDPLLHLRIKDMAIDFYVFIDERYVRFMRQTADLDLPLSLDIDGMNQIVPMIGELDSAFGNVRVTDSSLLKESPTVLARLFPSLLPAVSGSLTSALKPIQLPSFSGLTLLPVQITSTPDTAGVLTFLGLYLKLALPTMPILGPSGEEPLFSVAPDAPQPMMATVRTRAELVSVEVPTAAEMAVTAAEPKSPRVVLSLGADSPTGGPVEWQYRVDNGLWHPFDDQRLVTISEAGLRLPGKHAVQVRGRAIGAPDTLDKEPARVEFVIAPAVATAAAPVVKNNDGSVDHVASGCSQSRGRAGGSGLLFVVAALGLLRLFFRRGTLRRPVSVQSAAVLGSVLVLAAAGCKEDVPVIDNPAGPPDLAMPGSSGPPKAEFSANDEIGRYQSAVVNGGKIYISAYDSTFGDLAFATVADPQQKLVWYPVDGLPSGDPQNTDGNATRGGYVDLGDDIGRFTSLAFTGQGVAVIAYQDVTNNAVKLAIRDGEKWNLTAITDPKEGVGLGAFNQLVLDPSGIPTVAYMVAGVANGMGVVSAQLVVATAKSAKPTGPADWTKKVVEATPVSCAGLCGANQACVYVDPMVKDKNNTVCKTLDKTCSPSCKANTACQAGKCVDSLGTPPASLPLGTGLFAKLVSDKSGPQLLFYSRSAGGLRLASGTDWKVVTLAGGDGKTDLGRYIGAAIGDDGTLHIAFSSADGRLFYQTAKAGVAKTPELVDDGSRTVAMATETHSVGAGAFLYLDGGKPVIAYQDSTSATLELARRDTMWTHKTAAAAPNTSRGFYPQAVQLAGKWWLLDVGYDRAADAFTSVHFTAP